MKPMYLKKDLEKLEELIDRVEKAAKHPDINADKRHTEFFDSMTALRLHLDLMKRKAKKG